MEVMQTLKDAMDPKGILNPGKMGLQAIPSTDVYEHQWLRALAHRLTWT